MQDNDIRIVESNEDLLLFDTGHIPGAVHIDWRADLQDPVVRDYISHRKVCRTLPQKRNHAGHDVHLLRGQGELVGLLRALGVPPVFGHEKVKILNGGRDKWKAEGRPMTRERSRVIRKTDYPVPAKRYNKEIRAFADEALAQSKEEESRSSTSFTGGIEGRMAPTCRSIRRKACLRGGHIPGREERPVENRDERR